MYFIEEASKQEQIEDFLKKYKSFNDVPVKDMRHIIPLLLMEVYVEKYGQYTKKGGFRVWLEQSL